MPSLDRDLRRKLEKAVVEARKIAEKGARKALEQLGVHEREAYPHMSQQQRDLRSRLRAHGRQLGDVRDAQQGTQTLGRLQQACAYEHWHRMLFARFLAENELLLEPDSQMAISLDECRELARELGRDWLELAAEYAQKMLLAVFRADDPVLEVALPPETQQRLEATLEELEPEIFTADDSLGWVYQFWQAEEKERVNKSEVEIGANELAPVTQLFTEDYMVLFLLENTLGAWWTAKRRAEGKDPALPGYEWTYLRLNEDGTPAAGAYDGWPRTARELRVLDPCMGSGHFLTFALPILARMRVEEEGLSLEDAIKAVLRDNLFGLELDARCSQIAAFNLALRAWRLAGRHYLLPALNLACSGLGINSREEEWLTLAGDDSELRDTMRELYGLFKQAPILGSLIDPSRFAQPLLVSTFQRVRPLLEDALHREGGHPDERELAVAAQGVLSAARLLASQFSVVVTNVPYLLRGKQSVDLQKYCDSYAPEASADLATVFVERCARFCSNGGSYATVTPQNWLFLKTYAKFRKRIFSQNQLDHVATIGSGATATASWDVLRALTVISRRAAPDDYEVTGVETDAATEAERAERVRSNPTLRTSANAIRRSPNCRITLSAPHSGPLLAAYADSLQGLSTGDNPRFQVFFWEIPFLGQTWSVLQGVVKRTMPCGGQERVFRWEEGQGSLTRHEGSAIRGRKALGKLGVVVSRMRHLPATIFRGTFFDINVAVLVPKNPQHNQAIWAYCSSSDFTANVRRLDKKLNVTNATLAHVPFDLRHWQNIAQIEHSAGTPSAFSASPDQWVFDGQIDGAHVPLQVAVSRLLGYQWPRQTGSSFLGSPTVGPDALVKHADTDGVVCLSSLAGEPAAEQRLRNLLADAFGDEWSAQKLSELLGDAPSLKIWLRDRFFEEHCNLFHQRPFVWHIWDGRKDGFHALVNYHKLAGPNGEGRRTLEKLIYTSLGDWITRQRAEEASGADGAEARLLAAEHLQKELIKILHGEPPYDLFIRWKPLHEQPVGWEPDLNDGVRLNIRPWLQAKPYKGGKNACILRWTPKSIKHGKDRGKEPVRDKEDYPWFWSWDQKTDNFEGGKDFDGNRWNDLHYTREAKQKARERHAAQAGKA